MNILLTGITGQDASYLAELLLEKNHTVYGLIRRQSVEHFDNINHILNKVKLIYGDLSDQSSLINAINIAQPEEIYHLGAQSFVGTSWDQPEMTADITALGTLRMLEAIRKTNSKIKFIQASSSEMYGRVLQVPQTEETPLNPVSPYACAKTFAHFATRTYRFSYNMFASTAISFNHESVTSNSPVIIKDEDDLIDVLPIVDLFKTRKNRNKGFFERYKGILKKYKNKMIWDGDNWTKILNGTSYNKAFKKMNCIQTRKSCCEISDGHVIFLDKAIQKQVQDVKIGDIVYNSKYPNYIDKLKFDYDLAKAIGFIVGDGYINDNGEIRLINANLSLIENYAKIFQNQFGCKYKIDNKGKGGYPGCKNDIYSIEVRMDRNFGLWLKKNVYTNHYREKRIPKFILNADILTKQAFLDGYYDADGRNAGHERYKYKGWTTSSATLSLGLSLLINELLKIDAKVKLSYKEDNRYYYCQLRNPNKLIHHAQKNLDTVIKIFETKPINNWFFDLQTESQSFSTGPNLFKIHNSPRRGKEFVTRKISLGVAKIKLGLANKISLGNLESKRDWSHAKDIVNGMYLIMQHNQSDDFVLCSGETHSIREFLDEAFNIINIKDWQKYIEIDQQFMRPSEVNLLLGDYSKAKKILNWEPKVTFKELVKEMVESDIRLLEKCR